MSHSPSYKKGGREVNGDLAAYSLRRVSDICVILLASPHRHNLLLLTWSYHEISQNSGLTLPITGFFYEVLWCLSGKVTCTWFLEQSISRISKPLHMKTQTCSQGRGYYKNKKHGETAKVKKRGKMRRKQYNKINDKMAMVRQTYNNKCASLKFLCQWLTDWLKG